MKYLVTWNIPSIPDTTRVKFYYRLKRILLRHEAASAQPRGSVILLDSEEIAREVCELAKGFGEAWIYEAKEIS